MTNIVDLPPERGRIWLLALLGVTIVGNVDTAPHPVVEWSSIILIFFLSSGAVDLYMLPVVNDLLLQGSLFYFLGC